jgi:hypothetical protein
LRRLAVLCLFPLMLAGAACPRGAEMAGDDERPEAVPPARDGNVAIAQELEAARKAGTAEAYDLFLARHPEHPLAQVARAERERLQPRDRP